MEGAGNELLAGTGFAQQDDRKRAACDARQRGDGGGHGGRDRGETVGEAVNPFAILVVRILPRGCLLEPEQRPPRLDDVAILQARFRARAPVHPRAVGRLRIGDPPPPVAADDARMDGGQPCIGEVEEELPRFPRARRPPSRSPPEMDGIDTGERVPRGTGERPIAFEQDDELRGGLHGTDARTGGAEHRRASRDFRSGAGSGDRHR